MKIPKIVELGRPPTEPHQPTINMLKNMLEQAESGELQGAAMVAIYANKNVGEGYFCPDQHEDLFRLFGTMEYLKHRIMSERFDED